MITFVYCCICLLIVCCQTARIESEENSDDNDSPDTLPKVTTIRRKIGEDILIRCCNFYPTNDSITLEFKHCDTSFRGLHWDDKNLYKLNYSDGQWKRLNFNRKNKKLEIKNVTEENMGLYRCLNNDSIIKIYVVDLDIPATYSRQQPKIVALIPSLNTTVAPNTPIVIQCKVSSTTPPEIRWFKEFESHSLKCEGNSKLPYNGHCYSPLPAVNDAYAKNNKLEYISKLNIDKSRSFHSGTYVCLVMTEYGADYKNVTIKVGDTKNNDGNEGNSESFSLLFVIPLFFVLVPTIIWLGFYKRKNKTRRQVNNEHQKQLIKSFVDL